MSKLKLSIILGLIIALVMTISVLSGCKTATTDTTVEATAATETIEAETTAAMTETTAAVTEAAETTASSSEQGAGNVAGKKIGVASIVLSNEWCNTVWTAAQDVCKVAGMEVFGTDAGGDVQKMREDILSLIAKNPDLLIIATGDNELFQGAMQKAADAGIKIIDIEAFLEAPNVVTHLYADQLLNGIMDADNIVLYLANKYNGFVKGKVVEVMAPTNSTVIKRIEATKLKLKWYANVTMDTVSVDATNPVEDSRIKLEAYLQSHPDVDVVTAYQGEMLTGSVLAVDGLGLGDKIKVMGMDAFEPILQLMRQGKPVIAAVQQDGYAIGTVATKLAVKILSDPNFKPEYQYILPLINIYNNFPGKENNFPLEGRVKIPCPAEFKDKGIGWDY